MSFSGSAAGAVSRGAGAGCGGDSRAWLARADWARWTTLAKGLAGRRAKVAMFLLVDFFSLAAVVVRSADAWLRRAAAPFCVLEPRATCLQLFLWPMKNVFRFLAKRIEPTVVWVGCAQKAAECDPNVRSRLAHTAKHKSKGPRKKKEEEDKRRPQCARPLGGLTLGHTPPLASDCPCAATRGLVRGRGEKKGRREAR